MMKRALVAVIGMVGLAGVAACGMSNDAPDTTPGGGGGCGGGGSDTTSSGQLASFTSAEMGSGEWNSYVAVVGADHTVSLTSRSQEDTIASGTLTFDGAQTLTDIIANVPLDSAPVVTSTCGDGVGMTLDISFQIGGLHHYELPLGDSCGEPAGFDDLTDFLVDVATAIQTGASDPNVTIQAATP